jgi:spore germination protein YaaH
VRAPLSPRSIAVAVLAAAVLAAGALGAGAAASRAANAGMPARAARALHRHACSGPTPGNLRLKRLRGPQARLTWKAPRGVSGAVSYRVKRQGRTVGQTTRGSIVLRVTPGRLMTFSVQARTGVGSAGCWSKLRSRVPFHGPGRVVGLRIVNRASGGVTLGWKAAARGDAPIAGYRIERDAAVAGQTHGRSYALKLSAGRSHRVVVVAVDTRGHVGPASGALVIGASGSSRGATVKASTPHEAPNAPASSVTAHTPPSAPTGLSASDVTSTSAHVSWTPSTTVSGEIVGYRVYRDGETVGQAPGPEMTLANLAPSSDYEITVVAVDSLGAISEPTPALVVHTAEPTPTSGTAQAFLLASTDQSFHDLQAHYEQIGVVYPTYFNCGVGGEISGSDDPLVTGWAEARKIEVLPRLNCQNVSDEERVLNEPTARARMIENIASLCRTYGYQGIQIDFEGAPPGERGAFTAFVTALAERLHAQGDKLSTAVTAKYYNIQTGRAAMYDDAALSVPSDYMFVLDWGVHWTTSSPGSIDEYSWFKRVADYTATLPNLSKFVLGMPMYGIDWPNGGGSSNPGTPLEYEDIVALETAFGALPEWDSTALSPHFTYDDGAGVRHDVWFTDKQSIGARTALAASLGLKIGLWHLGSEDQSVWELPQLAAGA